MGKIINQKKVSKKKIGKSMIFIGFISSILYVFFIFNDLDNMINLLTILLFSMFISFGFLIIYKTKKSE